MEKKGIKKVNGKSEEPDVKPYADELIALNSAHVALVKRAWETCKDPVVVLATMHMIHHAMIDFEQTFIEDNEDNIDGK